MRAIKRIPSGTVWGPIAYIKGYMDGKSNIILVDGTACCNIRDSAYLQKLKYRYVEYKEQVHLKKHELTNPLKTQILNIQTRVKITSDRKVVVDDNLDKLSNATEGAELREKDRLIQEKENIRESIAYDESKISEIYNQIELIEIYEERCLDKTLAKLQRSVYSYILGLEKGASKSVSFDPYQISQNYMNLLADKEGKINEATEEIIAQEA